MQHSDLKSQGVCSLRYTRLSSGPAVCSSIEAVPALTESEERIVDRLTDESMVNSPLGNMVNSYAFVALVSAWCKERALRATQVSAGLASFAGISGMGSV